MAVSWSGLLSTIVVILKVAVALGAVVFVHELGHYLVARLCGVKIEKFMVGFDIGGYKLAWRRGETLYGIGILPLGGYVKMLGQDDDPAHVAEQMRKSQVDVNSAHAKPVRGPNGEIYYVDRRSYLAKSVPQRMAIISAGVIMNIIFAFIFAVIAYGMGVPYMPSIISETMPGSPAWQQALGPGDEIVQIGDRKDPTFLQLMSGITLGDLNSGVSCVVRLAATGEVVTMQLKPTQEKGRLAMVGISSPQSLVLRSPQATVKSSPAARARLVSPTKLPGESKPELQSGDKIVRVGDKEVLDYRGFAAELARQPDKPLTIVVERPVDGAATDNNTEPETGGEPTPLTFEIPTQELRDFGLAMKIGPIVAVQKDSPAEAAGLKVGDRIESVDEQAAGQPGGWTPDTLPDILRQAAVQNREVVLVVSRGSGQEAVTIRVKPCVPTMYYSAIPTGAPQGVEALGIAYRVTNDVHAVTPGGPASNAGIKPGDKLTGANVVFPPDENGKTQKPEKVELGDEDQNWTALVDAVQFAPSGTIVEFKIAGANEGDEREVSVNPSSVKGAYYAPRGFVLKPIKRTRTAATLADAMRFGWDETVDSLTMVVRFLQKLGHQVPITMLGGPGTIAAAAGGAASQGMSTLLIFLTMLSANLAVLNFLPIPLLDGGHFVFLAYEGIRGRPANEKFVVALHTAGFLFIVGLMLFVIGLDIQRWLFT
jgi:regulator of sigma E protease